MSFRQEIDSRRLLNGGLILGAIALAWAFERPRKSAPPPVMETYPAGWTVRVPGEGLDIGLRPTVAQQELDTRATTGVVYWEGSQVVSATRDGEAVGGEAYVELTGYLGTGAR